MKIIYAASFLHESNTFSHSLSDLEWFKKRCWRLGDEILERFADVKTEFGGFLDALSRMDDVKLIPIIAAEATPSGPVSAEVAETVTRTIVDTLRNAPRVDGVLLSLHGAMVTETGEDGEGDLAEAVRAAVGKEVPVFCTLDLHANVTEKMSRMLDVMIPYNLYPHTDKYERGIQTAQLLVRKLRGEIDPYMAVRKLPLLVPLISTSDAPMDEVADRVNAYKAEPGVMNVSYTHGFLNADIYESGAAVQVITDGDPSRAEEIAIELAQFIWEKRHAMLSSYLTPEQAAAEAMRYEDGLTLIADGPDNPGGGAYADDTRMLQALLNEGVKSAVLAPVYDPESVDRCREAREGSTVSLLLGGKQGNREIAPPFLCEARVLKLTDGRYRNNGPMNPGIQMDLLGTALVQIGGIRVIVVKNPTQPYDLGLMELHGIDVRQERVVVLKSSVHFRGAYGMLADRIIRLSYPGVCAQSPMDAKYVRCKRPIYPLDPDTQYASSDEY